MKGLMRSSDRDPSVMKKVVSRVGDERTVGQLLGGRFCVVAEGGSVKVLLKGVPIHALDEGDNIRIP